MSPSGQARRLSQEGRYDEAIGILEKELKQHPESMEARKGFREVLQQQVRAWVEKSVAAQAEGDFRKAFEALQNAEAAEKRGPIDENVTRVQRQALESALRANVETLLSQGQPLAAHFYLTPMSAFLREKEAAFSSVLDSAISELGKDRCQALVFSLKQVHLGAVVRRYCQTFGVEFPKSPVAPERRQALRVDCQVLAATFAASEAFQKAAERAFQASGWHEPRSELKLEARLWGSLSSHLRKTPVDVTWNWAESQSYSATEYRSESYQEPYVTTESYSYPCGSGTNFRYCTGSRTVTRSRSATRQVPYTVTKTRVVPRSLVHPAEQHTATHKAALTAAVALPGMSEAFSWNWEDAYEKSDYAHTQEKPEAQLKPKSADVMSDQEWLERQARRFEKDLSERLLSAWSDTFCPEKGYTPETAARCLSYPGVSNAEALKVLVNFFGEPGEAVSSITMESL